MESIISNMAQKTLEQQISDGVDLAKAGKALEVYSLLKGEYEQGKIPLRSHYPFGWILYYALHQSGEKAFQERKVMLKHYLQLTLKKPHKLHSMILTEAIRLYHDAVVAEWAGRGSANKESAQESMYVAEMAAPYGDVNADSRLKSPTTSPSPKFSIMAFSNLWDLRNLRDGDWKRKEYQGKQLNSTVERFITCYVNEMETIKALPSEEFISIIKRAVTEYPDSHTILAQHARVAMSMNETPLAVASLRKAILLAPSKFYLWSRLAMIAPESDRQRLRIALLYKALKAPGKEEFKGKVRLALAETWLSIKAHSRALHELQKIRQTYEANGWHLSSRYKAAEMQIPSSVTPVDPLPAYQQVEPMADDFIYSMLPKIPVKKSYHKESGKQADRYGQNRMRHTAWRVTTADGENHWFTPSKFGIDENLPVETALWIRLYAGKVVAAGMEQDVKQDA